MKSLASNTLLQNRYLIVQLIGRGGMGEVYLAIDQRLGNPVALKRTVFFDDDALGNAFEREARILARLRHNALPKVSDHFIEDGNQYLVMEYFAGDDLSKRLSASNKPFPLDWVMFWADRILDALDYLHSFEPPIVHRDIKPQNLKLTEDNQIVLLDFGLSKNTVGASRISASAAPSVIGYTPQYAPLEQIRGTGTNARSDIFSLSSTLYQLLTNQIPPDALSRADAILSEKPDPLASPTELNSLIPREISAVILKGMEISQDKRIESAFEMQKRLREAYAPETGNQKQVQADAFNSQAFPVEENISLKTNVTSIPKIEAQKSRANVRLNSADFSEVRNENAKTTPASLPKPVASNSVFNGFADLTSSALSASSPTERMFANLSARQPKESEAPIENKSTKSPSLFFATVGALILAVTALAFGFYKYNFAAKTEISTPVTANEPAPNPAVEAIVQSTETGSRPENEVVPSKISDEEKPATDTVEDSKNSKTIQPPNVKINQKSATSSDGKNAKSALKPSPKITRKPTPLPPILP